MNKITQISKAPVPRAKFQDRHVCADNQMRAHVPLSGMKTLWFNTGTLCNITCVNCYIGSSPTNDNLVYLSVDDVKTFLDQIDTRRLPVEKIGFTGGEPFMNPAIIDMVRLSLEHGYSVLILTNAMAPMMRKGVQQGLSELVKEFNEHLTLRVSIDHPDPSKNDQIRGADSHAIAVRGMEWLQSIGANMHVAGRTLWGESEAQSREQYSAFYLAHGFSIDANNPVKTLLFPEMNEFLDIPEVTTSCWDILNKTSDQVMCASSRMVVRRKGADTPVVLACTLLPYSEEFELGSTLQEAEREVYLNHPYCARFCVLGGASCST